jgi:DNA polymerase II small subunit/DNA polymerase delta subunit B
LAPNPAQFSVNDAGFVGHAGQPVQDIMRQSRKKLYRQDGSIAAELTVSKSPAGGADESQGSVASANMDVQLEDSDGVDHLVISLKEEKEEQEDKSVGTLSALDALECTVLWGHLAPTCPG